jgi:hypothetical protein
MGRLALSNGKWKLRGKYTRGAMLNYFTAVVIRVF